MNVGNILAFMSTLSTHLKHNGIRQLDFADEIGIEQSMVSKLANEKAIPTLELAWRIEKATGGNVSVYSWLDQAEVTAFRDSLNKQQEAAE